MASSRARVTSRHFGWCAAFFAATATACSITLAAASPFTHVWLSVGCPRLWGQTLYHAHVCEGCKMWTAQPSLSTVVQSHTV